jgi:hypothetical protein
MTPFRRLAELASHEQQLLARMTPHEAVDRHADLRIFPIPIAGHAIASIEPLPCTTSSWLIGRMKFSENA